MRLKKKVSKQSNRPQEQARQEELAFLKSVESRISTLQDAKFCADGLASIHLFLAAEGGGPDEEFGPQRIYAGVEDICSLLARCLTRETDEMERMVWGRKKLLEPRRKAR